MIMTTKIGANVIGAKDGEICSFSLIANWSLPRPIKSFRCYDNKNMNKNINKNAKTPIKLNNIHVRNEYYSQRSQHGKTNQ
jgi:hypothetical protein